MKKIKNKLNSKRHILSTISFLLSPSRGFTLLEILIAVMILAVGILTVSQMTILGLRTNRVIRDRSKAREILAEGMEVLKILDAEDPLLIANKDTLTLDDTTGAYRADTTNIVGRTVTHVGYNVYWNIVDDHPNAGLKTIRMFVFRQDKRLIHADYVRWR
ncbi:MAG: prepilin-type N-terminal cleavage/methylation domain-containing protein [candidate division WOR-3 bacterium]|nr:MAG: prepilin-type N-terminal cleavage/methylation domain-containing protein [candidate division WOR-3 bacterium]